MKADSAVFFSTQRPIQISRRDYISVDEKYNPYGI
jgi:hypothetical protein